MNNTIYNPISPEKAKALGMKKLTVPSHPDSDFIKNVQRDMERIPGTIWATVQAGVTDVEIWRVMIPSK